MNHFGDYGKGWSSVNWFKSQIKCTLGLKALLAFFIYNYTSALSVETKKHNTTNWPVKVNSLSL